MHTVYAAFEATAQTHSAKPFLCDSATWQDLSYREALARVKGIAEEYRGRGCGPGHRVAVSMQSGPTMLLHFLALNSLGASFVPINPDYQPAELEYVVLHSEAFFPEKYPDIKPKSLGATECALLYTSGTTGKPKGCLLSNEYFLALGRRYIEE